MDIRQGEIMDRDQYVRDGRDRMAGNLNQTSESDCGQAEESRPGHILYKGDGIHPNIKQQLLNERQFLTSRLRLVNEVLDSYTPEIEKTIEISEKLKQLGLLRF